MKIRKIHDQMSSEVAETGWRKNLGTRYGQRANGSCAP